MKKFILLWLLALLAVVVPSTASAVQSQSQKVKAEHALVESAHSASTASLDVWAQNALAKKPKKKPLPPLLDSTKKLTVLPAWQPVNQATYPACDKPAYDVTRRKNLMGWIGLQPLTTPATFAEITFRWYDNPEDCGPAGATVRGFPITSNIPSTAQLMILNLGNYLRVEVQCFLGPGLICPPGAFSPFGMKLWGTNRWASLELITGDVLLVTEKDYTLAANGADAVHVVYPAGYYHGDVRMDLDAPPGVTATLWAPDLEHHLFPKEWVSGKASVTARGIFGYWFVLIANPTGNDVKYNLTVTALESARTGPPPK